jgi:integrase
MAVIFKRSNGIYYIRYEEDGQIKWKSTHSAFIAEGREALRQFERLLEQAKPRTPFDSFVKDFLKHAQGTYSKTTQTIYRSALHQFSTFINDKPLPAISSKDADQFKVVRMGQVSPVSVNISLKTLKAAFYTALRWDMINKNPFKGVAMMRIPDQAPVYFSKEEFSKFLSIIREDWFRDLVVVGVLTGLRRGELLSLTWADVDFERNLIHVHSSENFRTKSGKRRYVPMNKTVIEVLCRVKESSKDSSVFNSGHKVDIGHIVGKRLKKYIRQAELNPKLHFHSLRHTFATWLVQDGVGIYEVQKLLGHSSIAVTQIYSHLASSELHSAVSRIALPL